MTDEPFWIDREELHLLCARQVELFGGTFGVRDEGMVESALHRPRVAPADELLTLVLAVPTSDIDERSAAAWFRAHAEPGGQGPAHQPPPTSLPDR